MVKFRFFDIEIPEIQQSSRLASKSEAALLGKVAKLPLSDFVRGKSGELKYVIEKGKEGKGKELIGKIKSVQLFLSYVSRFVRRGVTKMDESFKVDIENGKAKMQLKPIIMTRKKVGGAVARHLRKEAHAFLQKHLEDAKPEDVFAMVLRSELQQKLSQRLKKIYPLAYCEIREAKLLGK